MEKFGWGKKNGYNNIPILRISILFQRVKRVYIRKRTALFYCDAKLRIFVWYNRYDKLHNTINSFRVWLGRNRVKRNPELISGMSTKSIKINRNCTKAKFVPWNKKLFINAFVVEGLSTRHAIHLCHPRHSFFPSNFPLWSFKSFDLIRRTACDVSSSIMQWYFFCKYVIRRL